MARELSHLHKAFPTVAHSCPAACVLPTMTSASLNIVKRKYGWVKITMIIHLTERRNWNPKSGIWGASPCPVTPAPSHGWCHHQALYRQCVEGFSPHPEACSAVFKEIMYLNPIKWVWYFSYITTYLVAYKKTSPIGWILTESKRLCVSLLALRRCSESWFLLPVCFNHFN